MTDEVDQFFATARGNLRDRVRNDGWAPGVIGQIPNGTNFCQPEPAQQHEWPRPSARQVLNSK